MKFLSLIIGIAVTLFGDGSLFATELYNLSFGTNDVGTYQTVYGNPTVQSSVGPFANALVFQPSADVPAGYAQIELPFDISGSSYDIQYNVLTHNLLNSGYGFSIYLDTPEVRSVTLDGNQNAVGVFQPSPYTDENVADFADDQAYHFDVSVDLHANYWSVTINGMPVFSNPINASSLEDIRFSLNPTAGPRNDSGLYTALDNVVVEVTPEPQTVALLFMALIPVLLLNQRKG